MHVTVIEVYGNMKFADRVAGLSRDRRGKVRACRSAGSFAALVTVPASMAEPLERDANGAPGVIWGPAVLRAGFRD